MERYDISPSIIFHSLPTMTPLTPSPHLLSRSSTSLTSSALCCVCILLCGGAVRQIGKGSFGSVFLAHRKSDGAQFVLKKMQIKNVPQKEIEVHPHS